MNNKQKQIQIEHSSSILSALKQMDETKHKLLIVTKENRFLRLLSIGDIQRAIIRGVDLNSQVDGILRDSTVVASVDDDMKAVKASMLERKNEFMPVIDDEQRIVDVIFWEDLFEKNERIKQSKIDLPVVIMAGGQGTRLRPLTNVLPKPLIPIGEQTMMEDIMDRFVQCGCNDFYVSLNYKAEFIRQYFNNFGKKTYHIEYFQEDKPLGTAGSLSLLKNKISKTFFVSNCDSIIDEDYSLILDYHRQNKNEITMISAVKSLYIPYGTVETGDNGILKSLREKPEFTFKINTGMYILEPHLLEEIPSNRVYHITYLIEKLLSERRRVGVYPINEGSWTDVGNWDEYLKQFVK